MLLDAGYEQVGMDHFALPDDELIQLASKGKLTDPPVLEQQVRRMLADSRAQALVNSFGSQWLLLRDVKTARPARPRWSSVRSSRPARFVRSV